MKWLMSEWILKNEWEFIKQKKRRKAFQVELTAHAKDLRLGPEWCSGGMANNFERLQLRVGWMWGWEVPLRLECEVHRSLITRGSFERNVIIRSQLDRTGAEPGSRALAGRLLSAIVHTAHEEPLHQDGGEGDLIWPKSQDPDMPQPSP